jgi:hypothetical protein
MVVLLHSCGFPMRALGAYEMPFLLACSASNMLDVCKLWWYRDEFCCDCFDGEGNNLFLGDAVCGVWRGGARLPCESLPCRLHIACGKGGGLSSWRSSTCFMHSASVVQL